MTPTNARRPAMSSKLRILATTDLHMQLAGFDYSADRKSDRAGLTHLARLIEEARAEAEAAGASVLLLDNGDGLQGSPLGDFVAEDRRRPHPLMQAFALLRYDAIGLGNHDLDFGIETLASVLSDSPCPVICSNLHLNDPATLPIVDRHIITLPPHGLKVGLFSCLPPQTAMWNAQRLRGRATISDILSTARKSIDDLQADGCDLVIALAHTGVGSNIPQAGMENAAAILQGLPGLDAVIAGHTHDILPAAPGAGALVLPGAMGSHLGIIDLDLERSADSRWKVSNAVSEARAAPEDQSKDLLELIRDDHDQTRKRLDHHIGHSDNPLHSYFASFAPDKGLAVLAHAQAAALKPYLANSELVRFPILSAVAPSRFGGRAGPRNYTDIPAGPISERHVFDLCPFDNLLCAGLLTGADVLDWLEMSAGLFAQIEPGETRPLLDPAFPGHNCDVIFGLEYEIDISVPPRFDQNGDLINPDTQRIRNACWNDRPLDPKQRFIVAMTSYRAAGGGNIPALRNLVSVALPDIRLRAILRDHFAGALPPSPLHNAPVPWRFTPVPQAVAITLTGPEARAHLDELCGREVTEAGMDTGGFLRLSVPLDPVSTRLAISRNADYIPSREVGAGRRLANPVRSGRKQP